MMTINTWVFALLYLLFGIVSYLLGAAVEKFIIGKDENKAVDIENVADLVDKLTVLSDIDVFVEEDGSHILKGKEGSRLKLDAYGLSVYDPEDGSWKALN